MRRFHFLFALLLLIFFFAPVGAQGIFSSLEPFVVGDDSLYRIQVQFDPALRTWFDDEGAPHFGMAPPSANASQLLGDLGLSFESTLSLDEIEVRALRMGIAPPPAANGFDISSMIGLAWVKNGPSWSLEEALKIGRQLLQLQEVLSVELWPETPIPPPEMDQSAISPPAATADYEAQQGYLDSAQGINARYAWRQGVYGEGVKIVDIEYDWNENHEEFVNSGFSKHQQTSASQQDHGTAVLGMLFARNNNFGVTGSVHQATIRGYGEWPTGRPATIANAARWLVAGDVMLLEMQTGTEANACSSTDKYGPADYTPSVWTAVKAAVDAGIIVVAAAGNGSCNMNLYQNYKGDNGSIIVGAGGKTRSKLGFSTYGNRVNLQGWGQSVYSTGYGDLAKVDGSANRTYTRSFSGTSSASPIVTSAVALVQSYAKKKYGVTLTPAQMRSLLMSTGRAQTGTTSQNIGPLPNVRDAFLELDRIHGGVSSSVAVSSSSKPFSSSIAVSSSAVGGICDGKPTFQTGVNYATQGYEAVYQSSLWSCKTVSHNCTVGTGHNPSSFGWVEIGICGTSLSSSAAVSSSSKPVSSSAAVSSSSKPVSSSVAVSSSSKPLSSSVAVSSSSKPLSSSVALSSSSGGTISSAIEESSSSGTTAIQMVNGGATLSMAWSAGVVQLQLPSSGDWTLSLHDLRGQRVQQLHLGVRDAGAQSVAMQPPHAGLWFVRLSGPQQAVLKIVER